MLRFISLFVLSEHCVQDGQQFTHTVNQRHFFWFFRLLADACKTPLSPD